jgi:hypothetical protein
MSSAATLRLEIERFLENRFPAALTPAPRTLCEVAETGIAAVDELLQGGLPVGAISEVTGAVSSGRTSLGLTFVARRTAEGRVCAWVDASDAFDPESAAANGVALRQLLWVRCGNGQAENRAKNKPARQAGVGQVGMGQAGAQAEKRPWTRLDQALRATDLLLQAGGFAAIVLDLADIAPEYASRIPLATWFRFRQAADRARSSLMVLGKTAYAQSSAAVVLECAPPRLQTAGETVLRGFTFTVRRGRERWAPVEIGTRTPGSPTTGLGRWGGKPPASAWEAQAAWETERRA